MSEGAANVPRHVAIIMDGNGRWAKKRMLPRAAGHKKGVEAVKKVARAAREMGIETLTLYAFSTENWSRPEDEIGALMGLMKLFIQSDLNELIAENVRLRIIGDLSRFDPSLRDMVQDAVDRTASNTGSTLAVALNYGSRAELVRAVRSVATKVADGEISADAVDEAAIEAELQTSDLPPLDLLIRTSGEQRLSNFLLWQAAYAELIFTDVLWPDFGPEQLQEALDIYASRHRRYGGL